MIDLIFGLKNFKAFRELQSIDIKPLTIICGANNCGKSSLLQSFLLMSQSVKDTESYDRAHYIQRNIEFASKKKKYKTTLLFEGKMCHLSHYNNILNTYSKTKEIVFKYDMNNYQLTVTFFNPFTQKMIKAFVKGFSIKGKEYDIEITSNLDEVGNVRNYNCKINRMSISRLLDNRPLLDSKHGMLDLEESYDEVLIKDYEINDVDIFFNGFLPHSILIYPNHRFFSTFSALIEKYVKNPQDLGKLKKILDDENELISKYEVGMEYKNLEPWYFFFRFGEISLLKNFFNSVHFIGPLREEPRRYYQFDDVRDLAIGNKGENAPQILTLYGDSKIQKFDKILFDDGELTFDKFEDKDMTLLDGLKIWSNDLGLPEIKTQRIEQTLTKVLVKLPDEENYVTLQDVGFGISQILPVYVEALRMNWEDTLILEQPEIHLHPSMQSKLADFLLSMAKSGRRFIIESHSEHMINRICLRIAQDQTNTLQNFVSMVFVEPAPLLSPEGTLGSIITKIRINRYGEVENWPVGFFDMTDHRKILTAGIEKRKRERMEGNKSD